MGIATLGVQLQLGRGSSINLELPDKLESLPKGCESGGVLGHLAWNFPWSLLLLNFL